MSTLTVEHVPTEQREAAILFLSRGHDGTTAHADWVWARKGTQILAVAGLSPPAGRVVDLVLPEADESLLTETRNQLVQLLIDRLESIDDLYFAQALIASEDHAWAQAVLTQQFRLIANIDLLAALPQVVKEEASAEPTVELIFAKDDRLLQSTVVATMVDAVDCLLLEDPRSSADLFEEYSVRCEGNRNHWYLVEHEGELIGCVILNFCISAGLPVEIVYLGVLPEFRGRQLGKRILQRIRELASLHARLVTAWVDQINQPALQIYTDSGFQSVTSSKLFVRHCE